MPVVKLPEIFSNLVGDIKMLSIRVLDSAVILVGSVICGKIRWLPKVSRKLEMFSSLFEFRRLIL